MVEDPLIMVITAAFGLFCNIVMAKVLHSTPGGEDEHGHSHGGNLFHQCSHDHGHGHGHGHGHSHKHNHKHDHDHKHDEGEKIPKNKVVSTTDGLSIPIIEEHSSESQCTS